MADRPSGGQTYQWRGPVDLAALRHVPTTRVHHLAGRLRCVK
ncbi:hypothetical protein AB7M49_007826 [Bradyrhizobium elkanii]|nr:hypothetical protein [Bradyrhizobium elkanii]